MDRSSERRGSSPDRRTQPTGPTYARTRREQIGLTITEVAQRAALGYSTVYRIETGRSRPNRSSGLLLATILGCTEEDLTRPADHQPAA